MTTEELEAQLARLRIVPAYIRGRGRALKLPDACRVMEISPRTYYNLRSAGESLPERFSTTAGAGSPSPRWLVGCNEQSRNLLQFCARRCQLAGLVVPASGQLYACEAGDVLAHS